MRKVLSSLLLLSLILPVATLAQEAKKASPMTVADPEASPAASEPARTAKSPQQSPSVRPNSQVRKRSYERETQGRHHSRMSKQEKIFLVAVAGTSMGIGALAGGAEGLAIGAIVGGWGAYVSHRLWHWIR